jgi:uncharacterized membrane protein YcaP (DUF421 family)
MSAFELVILIIISEATLEAMIDSDPSMTNAVVATITLVSATLGMCSSSSAGPASRPRPKVDP